MSSAKYRVETFIIPLCNNFASSGTKTDDAKLTDKLLSKDVVDCDIDDESFISLTEIDDYDPNSVIQEADNLLSALEDSLPLHDIQDSPRSRKDADKEKESTKETKVFDSETFMETHPSIGDVYTLGPIEEADEKETDDLCYHGCRNGCSATVPAPQQVSQEIFKENWLQKLEVIKKKENVLKNKEYILLSRERSLFVKEREIRLLEGNLRDRLKQVELYLNQIKRPEMKDRQVDTSDFHHQENTAVTSQIPIITESVLSEKVSALSDININCLPQDSGNLDNIINTEIEQKKISGSSSSSLTDINGSQELKKSRQSYSSLRSKGFHSSSSRFGSRADKRTKISYKPSYDDLDTTLSADIGDSSFVQTSQKFDPEAFKRPFAFRRSASERRVKYTDSKVCDIIMPQSGKMHKQDAWYPTEMEQGKILQRVTKNISASKEKTTKFQHYGLIDRNIELPQTLANTDQHPREDYKYSYLNLEMGSKTDLERISQVSRERPLSWNEGTNQWLQKKRQAYNMATKKMQAEDFENKENLKCNTKKDKQCVTSKKRDITNKLFTIFR